MLEDVENPIPDSAPPPRPEASEESSGNPKNGVPTRQSLLARLRDLGDDKSWQLFLELYGRLISQTAHKRGVPLEDAEDIVSEVVAGVAHRMEGYVYDPTRARFRTWLFRIIQNRVADYFRRKYRSIPSASKLPRADDLDPFENQPDPTAVQPDQQWDKLWQQSLLEATLARARKKANPRALQIYLYSETATAQGYSIGEIATHLGTDANNVSVARNRIKTLLVSEGQALLKEAERWEGPNGG